MSRKIRYSGYSFASILTPAQILGANYYDDWDAADLSLTNGDPVSSWLSKGNNGATLIQPDASQSPTYESGVYSFPTILADGINENMFVNNSTAMYKFLHNNQGHIWAIFEVVPANANALYPIVSTGGVASANVGYGLYYDDRSGVSRNNAVLSNVVKGIGGDRVSSNLQNNYFAPQQMSVLENGLDANTSLGSRNILTQNFGANLIDTTGSNSPSTADSTRSFRIFRELSPSFYANVRLARLIVSNANTTPTQDADMQTYLNATYGTFPI